MRIGNEVYPVGVHSNASGPPIGEVISVSQDTITAISFSDGSDLQIGSAVAIRPEPSVIVGDNWLGRIVGYDGKVAGATSNMMVQHLKSGPPPATMRRGIGNRLSTGWMVCDALLPICRGQRMGLFAGSGVGKSTLLGALANSIEADRVVIGLIGERSREVREFATSVLTPQVRSKAVIVSATAGEPPAAKKRAAYCAMTAAEHFRDQGHHVLLLMDSVTRFAEAHREIALLAGEQPALHAFPPSTVRTVAELLERAGPGAMTDNAGSGTGSDAGPGAGAGDITAIFSVLVAGSDLEEPVADMMRGILDGHIVLSREIAERGRYPAVNVLASVSRALPKAASESESALIHKARAVIATYEDALPMVQAGLYQAGTDSAIDEALTVFPKLDAFIATPNPDSIDAAFATLSNCLGSADD